jgi:hypothetical protein
MITCAAAYVAYALVPVPVPAVNTGYDHNTKRSNPVALAINIVTDFRLLSSWYLAGLI